MKKFVSDRVGRESEDMRDMLVKNRIRYLGRDWLDGDQISIAFKTLREEIKLWNCSLTVLRVMT